MNGFRTIHTRRLSLRAFEQRDAEPFAMYRSDPEVAGFQSWNTPYPINAARKFIQEMAAMTPGTPGEWFQIAVSLNEEGLLIGDCAFKVLADEPRQAEIGFTISRAHQRQGYGTESLEALFEYLFKDLKLHRIKANCDTRNLASGAVLRRVGMRLEGRFVDAVWENGEWITEDWYALLRREWERRTDHR